MSTNVAKAGIGYTLANILIKGINFFTLPIFSRVLGTTDFGIYNVFIAYDAIFFVVVGLALHSSMRSANWEFPGKIDNYVSSISIIYVLNMAILIAIALLFGSEISSLIGLSTAIIICLVIHSVGSAIVSLYNSRVSLQYSYKKYMLVASITSIGNVALSLILIFSFFHADPALGRILGATIAVGFAAALILFLFWKKAKPRICAAYWKFGIKYSTPIIFHGLSQVIMNQMGRLMINYMVSAAAAGIYGLAASLQIILVVVVDSISTVWFTWYYESIEGEKAEDASGSKIISEDEMAARRKKIRTLSGTLTLGFTLFTVCVMALVPEIIWVLGGSEYEDGTYCAFGMVLSGFCIFLYNLVSVSEYHQQKTHYIMVSTIIAAIVNIVLNYIFIISFGYLSAAYATLIAYLVYVLIHWIVSRKLAGFSIIPLKIAALSCVVLCLSTIGSFWLVDMIVVRILVNALICIPVAVVLLKQANSMGGFRKMLKSGD